MYILFLQEFRIRSGINIAIDGANSSSLHRIVQQQCLEFGNIEEIKKLGTFFKLCLNCKLQPIRNNSFQWFKNCTPNFSPNSLKWIQQ